MIDGTIWLWVGFNLFVLALLALDLGVFHRHAHAVSVKEATMWSVIWITLALLFNAGLYLFWDVLMPGSAYTNGEAGLAFKRIARGCRRGPTFERPNLQPRDRAGGNVACRAAGQSGSPLQLLE